MTLLRDNRELLDRFRRGEREALGQVYEAYVDRLAAFLRGGFSFRSKGEVVVFKGHQNARALQDLLQETFSRAFAEKARLGYDGIQPYGPYLLTIARNLTIDHFRRKVREVFEPAAGGAQLADGPDLTQATDQPSPEAMLLDSEIRAIVRAFYEQLSAPDQRILQVYFLSEEGQREAAEQLSLTRHQLRKAIVRLRKRLQTRLARSGHLTPSARAAASHLALSILAAVLASELGGWS